ncbi:MAG: nicotinate-nucleotide adenylyltransferase [Rhizomicrobium sp.]
MNWIRPPGPVAAGLRIGLLGGSFNPAHSGHLHVSRIAKKRLGLAAVWWLVSPGNPLKPDSEMAPFEARLESARQVAKGSAFIRVTGLERELRVHYTIDTIRALRRRFPQLALVWLMGSDNLAQFGRWRRWQDLARLIPIAVVRRPGSIMASLNAAPIRRFGQVRVLLACPPAVIVLDGARSPESATRLRAFRHPGAASGLGKPAAAMLGFGSSLETRP